MVKWPPFKHLHYSWWFLLLLTWSGFRNFSMQDNRWHRAVVHILTSLILIEANGNLTNKWLSKNDSDCKANSVAKQEYKGKWNTLNITDREHEITGEVRVCTEWEGHCCTGGCQRQTEVCSGIYRYYVNWVWSDHIIFTFSAAPSERYTQGKRNWCEDNSRNHTLNLGAARLKSDDTTLLA